MSSVAERIDDPLLCVVHVGKGERIAGLLGELLNPVNSESLARISSACQTQMSNFTITITMNIGCLRRGLPR